MTIPARSMISPTHDRLSSVSPTKNTPSSDAVKGSPRDNVTAVEDFTYLNPLENKKYAKVVASSPICKATRNPFVSPSHVISLMNTNGDKISALRQNIIATDAMGSCDWTSLEFDIVKLAKEIPAPSPARTPVASTVTALVLNINIIQPAMARNVDNHHTRAGLILKITHSIIPENTGAL